MTTLQTRPVLDARSIRHRAATSGPWTREQLASVAVADTAAVILVLAAAFNAHGSNMVTTNVSWLLLALAGLGVSGVTHALFLLRARRVLGLAIALVTEPLAATPTERDEQAAHVHTAGAARFHRPQCAFAAGRPATPGDGGLAPCEVCDP